MSLMVYVVLRPGGDKHHEKLLHTIEISNITELAEVSNYTVQHTYCDNEFNEKTMTRPVNYIFTIFGHKRSDGAIALLKKVFKELL